MAENKAAKSYLDACKRAAFSAKENQKYLDDMTTERDIINSLRHAEEKGIKRGRAEGKENVAKAMKAAGLSVEMIMQCTGLPSEEVEKL